MTFMRITRVATAASALLGGLLACDDFGDVPAAEQDASPTVDSGTATPDGYDATGFTAVDAACTDFTGLSASGGPCRPGFASGVNVAWVNFAQDVPGPRLGVFDALFRNVYQAGGRVARWWFHVNALKTPVYDSNGFAMPIDDSTIQDVKSIIDTARCDGMMINISLWSFDMLKPSGGVSAATLANNLQLLTDDAHRQAYITNVLTPLATALAGYPGLYSWETFNEPEGMANDGAGWRPFSTLRLPDGGSSGATVPMAAIQKTVNWFAGAIHSADPTALVTNGTWEFQAVSSAPGMHNYYSDAALVAAGGVMNGTLDFYEVHYYMGDGMGFSPFVNGVSRWALDKPVVIGEFYALAQDNVADAGDLYAALYDGGYGGAWAWQYENSDGTNRNNGGQPTIWPAMAPAIANLYSAVPDAVICR